MWFSYDSEAGFQVHETEDEARSEARRSLDFWADCAAADGWSEEVLSVCWGKISQSIREQSREPSLPHSPFDEIVAYDLYDVREHHPAADAIEESTSQPPK